MKTFPLDEPTYNNKRPRDFSPFEDALAVFTPKRARDLASLLSGKTIPDIQQLMAAGELTASELTLYYVDRIRRYDVDQLNAVMELNPDALTIAGMLDSERDAGAVRGPMHGIPVLIKDNIATGDLMHTAAGAYALRNWRAHRDAFLVKQLRAAGAIILGKANLSEWANWMDPAMPNGFSTLGGQTRNPYGPFDPLGSSSGSAVGVAAGFAVTAVGTETSGSIISPARANSLVGIKTSRGLVSRDHILPLVDWMDVPGPLARTVTDAAIMLTAMTGADERDPATEDAASLTGADFTRFLNRDAASGLRIGLIVYSETTLQQEIDGVRAKEPTLSQEEIDAYTAEIKNMIENMNVRVRAQAATLAALGIHAVEIDASRLPDLPDIKPLLEYGFQDAFARFMAALGDGAPVKSLAAVVAINAEDPANRSPYGDSYVSAAAQTGIRADEYATLAHKVEMASVGGLRALLAETNVDLLLGGDELIRLYATAGFPAITLPMGYDDAGEPIAIILTGDYLAEPQLIAAAYAIEQVTQARREPDLAQTVRAFKKLHNATSTIAPSARGR